MVARGEAATFSWTILYCTFYLGVLALLGIVGKEALGSPGWYIVAVASVSFFAAMWFASKTKYFQKDAVDFFYYSVGMAGVVLVFFSQGPERMEISERLEVRNLELKRDEAEASLQAFENSVPRLTRIFEAITSHPDDFLSEVRRIRSQYAVSMTFFESASCYRALTGRDVLGIDRMKRHYERGIRDRGAGKGFDELRRNADQIAAEVACAAAQKRVAVERARIEAQKISLEDIIDNPSLTSALDSHAVHLGTIEVPLGTAVDAILMLGDETRLTARRKALTAALKEAETAYSRRNGEFDDILKAYKDKESTLPNLLRYHYWPYVLILLLSLKLSRPRS